MITLHFKTDKTNKSNYNTFVCLKQNGAVLIGESCQESDKKKRKEWKEKLLKDLKAEGEYLITSCIFNGMVRFIDISDFYGTPFIKTKKLLQEFRTNWENGRPYADVKKSYNDLFDIYFEKLIAL